MDALSAAHDAAVQMIDTSIVRVHQHAACIASNKNQCIGRSRGGLTSKIHALVDTNVVIASCHTPALLDLVEETGRPDFEPDRDTARCQLPRLHSTRVNSAMATC
jgi:hypothetical protein